MFLKDKSFWLKVPLEMDNRWNFRLEGEKMVKIVKQIAL
jgi:hypothetical protein